ncbi:MAG: glycoside hydrolase family 97 N-terminal domain-containing protein, partial [Bacteroidetes bacterium]|nr:glycoside hydrolase family 97 N-terminal domain-containing protein [Bacteroidota bacterium]
MKINQLILISAIVMLFASCSEISNVQHITSPDNSIELEFMLSEAGRVAYIVNYKEQKVIDTSYLGFSFIDAMPLDHNFKILKTNQVTVDYTWELPWGEQVEVRNHYNELMVNLQETDAPNRLMNITFRVFDDGIGFRYDFPLQQNLSELKIAEENTEFNLTNDYTAYWIPGDWDIYEHLYNTTKLSKINAISKRNHPNLNSTYIPVNAVNTPVTMKADNGLYLSFHEAALIDYSGMTLGVDTLNLKLKSVLVGSDNTEYKVKRELPFTSPWRTIQIADRAGDLIESKMILNLNEPNKIGDVSWFKPMK